MPPKSEVATPPSVFRRIAKVAGDDVLVGGQALAVWVARYGVEIPDAMPFITRDVDFLTSSPTDKASVKRYAEALHGKAEFPSAKAMTSLVGQAYKIVSDDEYLNVDVLWKLVGLKSEEVRKNATLTTMDDVSFLVMHPLDVLRSRLVNFHKIPAKKNEAGSMQLRLAIEVAREHLRATAARSPASGLASGRSALQPMVSAIEKLALDDAGRKAARNFGIHVADAIDPSLIPAGPFWDKKWPTLKPLMSDAYGSRFDPPPAAPAPGRKRSTAHKTAARK